MHGLWEGAEGRRVAGQVLDVVAQVAARRAHARPPEDGFAWLWRRAIAGASAPEQALLRQAAGGAPWLDLAAGRAGEGVGVAAQLGASVWAGVDTAFGEEAAPGLALPWRSPLPNELPLAPTDGVPVRRLVSADALAVVAAQPDRCAAVLISGLDHDVVPVRAWHRLLAVEVARVATGLVLTSESLASQHLPSLGWRRLRVPGIAAWLAAQATAGGAWHGCDAWVRD